MSYNVNTGAWEAPQYAPTVNPDLSSISNYGSPSSSMMTPALQSMDPNGLPQIPDQALQSMNVPGKTFTGIAPFKLGWNIPSVQMGMQGLQVGANVYNAIQQAGLARDQLNYTKQIGNANLANQIKSYNTALTDRETSRGSQEGTSAADMQAYINANKMTR